MGTYAYTCIFMKYMISNKTSYDILLEKKILYPTNFDYDFYTKRHGFN